MQKLAVFGRFLRMAMVAIGCIFVSFQTPAFAECDGEGVALTSGPSDTRSFDDISSIITGAVGSTSGRKVNSADNLDTYLLNQEWDVRFDDGVVHGYSGCGTRAVRTGVSPYPYPTSTFTDSGVYSGCLCSLDKENWYVVNNSGTKNKNAVEDDSYGTSWEARNEYCRQYCAQNCAEQFASDENGLRTAMVNGYGSCPAGAGGGQSSCPENQVSYFDPNTGESTCIDYETQCNIVYGATRYWDGDSCEYKDTTYCQNNFGYNYIWDNNNLLCITQQEQCNSNSDTYWDYNSDTCKYHNDDCINNYGYNWFWNGSICEENCTASYGSNYSWSNSRNTCVNENGCTINEEYDNGICHTPCGSEYYWHVDGCVLKDDTYCETNYASVYYWDGSQCVIRPNPDGFTCYNGITSNGISYSPSEPLDAVIYNGEEVVINSDTYYEYNGGTYALLTGSGNSYNLAHASSATNKDYDDPAYLQYMAELEYYIRGMDWIVELDGATLHGYSVCNAGSNAWTKPYGGEKTTPLSGTYNGCSCSLDKQRWVIYGKVTDGSGWETQNTYCRKNCPYLCAQAVATDSTFRQAILNNSCEIPEWDGGGSGGGDTPVTCESNQIAYRNSCIDAPFVVTTMPNTGYFKFTVTAQGTYYVDWGDGVIRSYTNNQPGELVIDHDYSISDPVDIRIGTTNIQAYSTTAETAAISFANFPKSNLTNTAEAIARIRGSLALLFPTLGDGNSLATQPRFFRTFNNCTNLSGSLSSDLFAELTGSPVDHIFFATFMGCSNITGPIPENFFGGVSGQPATYGFDGTFSGCSGLGTENGVPTYSIPEHLFDNIRCDNCGVQHMFPGTFYGCSGLTGSIPKYLFRYISGEPTTRMFAATFRDCSNLTGSIPKELFENISGSLVDTAFRRTFMGTSSLESWIPPELFENMNNDNHTGDGMLNIFEDSGINTQCPDGYYEYQTDFTQYWDGHVSCKPCPAGTTSIRGQNVGPNSCFVPSYTCRSGEYLNISGETPVCDTCPIGYYCPQGTWTIDTAEDSKTLCPQDTTSPAGTMDEDGCFEPVFEIDIKAHTKPFVFRVAARGNLLIDWGDGSVEKIVMNSTAPQRIQHYYSDDDHDPHTIGINGTIYEYYTGDDYENDYVGAITFGQVRSTNETNSYDRITAIRGSLGKIFKTIGAGDTLSTQPRFIHTFNNCDQITSTIPEYIFTNEYDSSKDVHGAPVPYMFFRTFAGCTGITGTITANLFKNIAGAPAEGMFSNTFYNCQSIDSTIPPTLFAGISGPIKEAMYSSTFSGCKNLHGTIPAALFGNVYGAPQDNMYSGTFDGCINLEGSIPSGLFGNISGPARDWMFNATFYNCPKLSGYIPTDLFGTLSGDPGWMMFYHTFMGDSQIIGFKNYDTDKTYRFIPSDFYGNINNVNYDADNLSMLKMFQGTAIYTKCPPGYYFHDTGFTEDISPYVSCDPCPYGTTTSYYGAMSRDECLSTSFVCTSNKWLRVGDDDKICLTNQKPSGTKSLAIQTSDGPYYIPLSTADINMNEDSTKKMRVFYNGQTYSAHDESVQP